MPEELKFIASIQGFDKVEQALVKQTQALTGTAIAADKLDTSLKKIEPVTKGIIAPVNSLAASSTKLSNGIQSVGSEAQEAIGNMTGLGASLPTAAISLLSIAVYQSIKALIDYYTSISAAAQANIDLTNNLQRSAASVAGTVSALESLVSIARDVTRTDAERSQAIGKLNEDYKGFNKSLTLNNINTAESIELINKQTNAIVRNAQIKGLENLISKESEVRAQELTKKIGENLTTFQKFRAAAITLTGRTSDAGFDALSTSINNTKEVISESTKRTELFTNALKTLLSEGAAAGDLFTEKLAKPVDVKIKPEKAVKDIKTVQDELDKLELKLQSISAIGFAFNENKSIDKIKAITSVIEKLIVDFKVAPDDTIIKKLFGDIELLRPITPKLISFTEKVQEDIASFLSKPIVAPVKPVIDLEPLEAQKDQFFLKGTELSEALMKGMQNGLESMAENIAINFGELLGKAFSGGVNIGDFFKSLFNQVGAGLKELGVYFIKTAIQVKVFKDWVTNNPYLAVAAGIALIAIGTAIQSATAKKKAFATGGLVGGVGNRDTVDALLTPGEFVMTKSAVQRIGIDNLASLNRGGSVGSTSVGSNVQPGVQSMVINGQLKADGKDLILVFNRASQSLSRVG